MDWGLATWLGIGFGLGLVHAFDADHVMAVSVFATQPEERSKRSSRGFASGARTGLRWALGHGAVLLLCGIALWALGQQFAEPLAETWSVFAEQVVGVMMVGLGAWVLYEIGRKQAHLHFHAHDDLPPHAHWHVHSDHAPSVAESDSEAHRSHSREERDAHRSGHEHRHEHAPIFVGGVHGLAGSAPILAVIPAAAHSPSIGIAYLSCFALGVGIAMAAVSGLLGHLTERLRSSAGSAEGRDPEMRAADSRSVDAPAGDVPPKLPSQPLWSPLTVLRGLSASGSILVGLWMVGAA